MPVSPETAIPRVMLDTGVLLAGIVWPRWPYKVLRHAVRGDFRLVLSEIIIQEANRKFLEKFPHHVPDFVTFLARCDIERVAAPTAADVLRNRNLMRDITDVPIAVAAIEAQVDYFVSEDKDFTAHDETTANLDARLTIFLTGTFLRQIMGWSSENLESIRHRTWEDLRRHSERSDVLPPTYPT